MIVPAHSGTLGLPGSERSSLLNGNHLEICKFSGKYDDNYVRVGGHLSRLVKELEASREDPRNIER